MSTLLLVSAACSDSSVEDEAFDAAAAADDGAVPADGGRLDGRAASQMDARASTDASRADAGARDAGDETECGVLIARIRDFTPMTNPDFESFGGALRTGIVAPELGADGLPVFAAAKNVTSKASFDQWYRDVPGVNIPIDVQLTLTPVGNDQFEYINPKFFPIDGAGFGNYGSTGHNFHFTTQIRTEFKYVGGELFEFEGDDDLWIFVNGKLALDLGGVHSQLKGTIDFDAQKDVLGISAGNTYRMDIFHAERHTIDSNFKIKTTIGCIKPVPFYF